jgi:hypothetical protein
MVAQQTLSQHAFGDDAQGKNSKTSSGGDTSRAPNAQ